MTEPWNDSLSSLSTPTLLRSLSRCHPSSHMYYCTFCSTLYRWLIDWLADSLSLLRTPLMFPSPSFTSIRRLVLQKDSVNLKAMNLNGPLMKYVYDGYMILSLLALKYLKHSWIFRLIIQLLPSCSSHSLITLSAHIVCPPPAFHPPAIAPSKSRRYKYLSACGRLISKGISN